MYVSVTCKITFVLWVCLFFVGNVLLSLLKVLYFVLCRLNSTSSQDKTASTATATAPLTLTSPSLSSPFPLSSCLRWVGHTHAKVMLGEGESTKLRLRAGFLRPGTYNVNTLAVFVTYTDDQSQMILQRQTTPSIITLLPQAS